MNNTLRDTNSRIDGFSASLLSRLRRDRSIARMVLILLVAIGIFSILSPSVFLTGLRTCCSPSQKSASSPSP